jgi:hypothetical protein
MTLRFVLLLVLSSSSFGFMSFVFLNALCDCCASHFWLVCQ